MFVVKWQNGASGVMRHTFSGAMDCARQRAAEGHTARVYDEGAPRVLLATVTRTDVSYTDAAEYHL